MRKLSFTGSTGVGKTLLGACAGTVKKVSMELGGNAPFIVFADADLDRAVDGLLASKFRNAGQTCVCANRVFVEAPVYEAFAAKLRRAVSAFVVGNGLTPGVTIGPLIDDEAVAKVEEHMTDAAARGATVYLGGQRHPLGGTFFEPTILTDVPTSATIMHEETFGPVAPLARFRRRPTSSPWPTTRSRAWPPTSTRAISRAPGASPKRSSTAWSGSTKASSPRRSRRSAASSKPASVAKDRSTGIEDYLEIKYVCMGGGGT